MERPMGGRSATKELDARGVESLGNLDRNQDLGIPLRNVPCASPTGDLEDDVFAGTPEGWGQGVSEEPEAG